MLASALLVTAISHWFASRELYRINQELKPELRRLREYLGEFEVEDRTKCYAICEPQVEKGTFVFRLYLPPEHRYVKHNSLNQWPPLAITNVGEMTFKVHVNDAPAGMIDIVESGFGKWSTTSSGDRAPDKSWIKMYSSVTPSHYRNLTEIKRGEPIRLLEIQVRKASDGAKHEKIEIWLEEPGNPLKRNDEEPEE